jgi:hypothetical protein
MCRLAIFVIALLLAAGAMEPTGAWLVTLAVLAGISLFRPRLFHFPWSRWSHRPSRRWEREFDW